MRASEVLFQTEHWENLTDIQRQRRTQILEDLAERAGKYSWNNQQDDLTMIPMFHATNQKRVSEICDKGFTHELNGNKRRGKKGQILK